MVGFIVSLIIQILNFPDSVCFCVKFFLLWSLSS